MRKILWFTSTVIVFAFAFLLGRTSVFARGSMIEMPCSSAGMVSMNVTSRRNVRSMREVMSIEAFVSTNPPLWRPRRAISPCSP